MPELALGGLCVGSLVIYLVAKSAPAGAMGPFGSLVAGGMSFGFGGYLLVLGGALLLLTGTGRLRQTPGL